MPSSINLVKVFSVTKARDREELGERVMAWISSNPRVEVVQTVIAQSSDARFHCVSIVLLCASA